MQQRKLGQSDITVAPLAFGGNVFGWSIDEKTSFSILDKFVEAGLNLIDTADVYSRWAPGNQGGESETIIGKWLAQGGRRDKVVIATKVGKDMGEGRVGLKKDYILRAVEDSLRRLQTDHIDLYQSHDDDRSTPLEETLAAYDTLVKAGKVRLIGGSNYEVDRLAQARDIGRQLGLPLYQTLQPEYSLVAREGFERTLEPYCLEQGVGVIGFYSLASGFLSGKYRSEADLGKSAARGGKVKSYLNPRGFQILAALDAVAARHASTSAAVALAWLIARPSVTAPIASATSLAQLDELVAATRLQLSREDIAALDQASAY
ncbi:aldo/keto reductase [Herbaspirillum sp. BH-1]|uniref:aldo/keto reductase n=1 Tax=Herbaspirillum sp. (strain BH-1) TaxID=2058884 RepID=UPI000C87E431|nr:aldo/keto reductase [Herbaspirillum sp. BH-1]PLY58729.1 aldo/keto reductase [Herbaspirillum sp. BH-1]